MAPKKVAKRRAGGGRKSQGRITGNREVLNLRVTPQVRNEIERAAKEHGISLNQEAQERLLFTLGYDHKAPHLRTLGFMVELVAKIIEEKTNGNWRKNPYTAKALQGAVEFLIADLGAKGDAAVPAAIAAEAEKQRAEGLNLSVDPHEVGAGAAQFILGQIRARIHSTKVLSSVLNPDLPPKEWRKYSYNKFDNLIDDLDL